MGSVFHVHGGRALLDRLAAAGIAGKRLEWCDPVCSGPTPAEREGAGAGEDRDRWYRTRAEYLASTRGAPDVNSCEERLRDQDRALEAIPAGSEVVIWVGPELFCQAILMRLLVLLAGRSGLRVSRVDPGDPLTGKGCGLVDLTPAALRSALAARAPVTPSAFALAARAWSAFTAPTAAPLVKLLSEDLDLDELPHLGAALDRHLADLPDGALGLSTSELRVLQALEAGPLDPAALLLALAAREPRPFFTDVMLDELLRRLARPDRLGGGPLVEAPPGAPVTITQRGRDVLAGFEVWSPDRWHGGMYIGAEEAEEDGEKEEEKEKEKDEAGKDDQRD